MDADSVSVSCMRIEALGKATLRSMTRMGIDNNKLVKIGESV